MTVEVFAITLSIMFLIIIMPPFKNVNNGIPNSLYFTDELEKGLLTM